MVLGVGEVIRELTHARSEMMAGNCLLSVLRRWDLQAHIAHGWLAAQPPGSFLTYQKLMLTQSRASGLPPLSYCIACVRGW